MRGRLDHEKERERESVRPRERERTRVQYWKPLSLSLSPSLSLSLSLSFSLAYHSLASPRSFPARLGDRPRQRGVPASPSPLHVIAAPASTCTSGESTQPTSRRPRCPASPHRGPRTGVQSRTDLLQTRPQRTPPLLQPFSCFIKQQSRRKKVSVPSSHHLMILHLNIKKVKYSVIKKYLCLEIRICCLRPSRVGMTTQPRSRNSEFFG